MIFDVLMWWGVQNYPATSVHFYSAIDNFINLLGSTIFHQSYNLRTFFVYVTILSSINENIFFLHNNMAIGLLITKNRGYHVIKDCVFAKNASIITLDMAITLASWQGFSGNVHSNFTNSDLFMSIKTGIPRMIHQG